MSRAKEVRSLALPRIAFIAIFVAACGLAYFTSPAMADDRPRRLRLDDGNETLSANVGRRYDNPGTVNPGNVVVSAASLPPGVGKAPPAAAPAGSGPGLKTNGAGNVTATAGDQAGGQNQGFFGKFLGGDWMPHIIAGGIFGAVIGIAAFLALGTVTAGFGWGIAAALTMTLLFHLMD